MALVEPGVGHTYTMISRDGNDHVGHVRLEPLGPNRTRLHFDEEAEMDPAAYEFVNQHNEEHWANASKYLTEHPEYRHVVARGLDEASVEEAGR